ncbi:hypothetical protein HMPREF1531_01481 [Propionibacterium sp. oral taxon 192 str. F0372]|uniref:alpha/beta fold hydrolase n=1 Tax=Propionibacterium sp. oral taxon 192 TaxID=671222 RepID=UPI00035299F3|nr:alpha/beta fold hydrolase [Propionibacterium sp. oral taxon 192]EPH03420.1 hypothetical protein HMPREF1531_01481 [Propionibacterium sp. oral taxon 192 str. F0372]
MDLKQQGLTISEVADLLGIPADTLRFFERRGVLPAMKRDPAGQRRYSSADIELLKILVHLRDAGMPLAEIAAFTGASEPEPDVPTSRIKLLEAHRLRLEARRQEVDHALETIQRKIGDYMDYEACSQLLARPDCNIVYAVQGKGPLLFLVGAPAGRGAFTELAHKLQDRFTVVTHDPRGVGASIGSPDMAPPTPQILAQDLAALVEHISVSTEPALFVGTSGGAVTLLEYGCRFPTRVARMVLHEPPLLTLLNSPEVEKRARSALKLAKHDPQQAVQEFFDLTGAAHHTRAGELPPARVILPPLPPEELDKNQYFLGQMAGPTVFYQPRFEALRTLPLEICAGAMSHNQLARLASQRLATILGLDLRDLPGNHTAASTLAPEFAKAVEPLLC